MAGVIAFWLALTLIIVSGRNWYLGWKLRQAEQLIGRLSLALQDAALRADQLLVQEEALRVRLLRLNINQDQPRGDIFPLR